MAKEIVRKNADGRLEGVDPDTGAILWTESKPPVDRRGRDLRVPKTRKGRSSSETHHYVLDGRGKKKWVQKGVNPDDLPQTIFPYCQTTCAHILRKITEGGTINDIGLLEGFPPSHIIHKWLRQHPEFKAEMAEARKARAEYYADMAIEIARAEKIHEKDVPGERLKSDLYRWGAEVNDRNTYGKHTKVTGDPNAPLAILVDTGIRRDGDEPTDVPLDVSTTPLLEEGLIE